MAKISKVEAIELLEREGKLPKLGEELYYTARLRVDNPSMSLSELALIHEPPISKSGLNRRLTRIMEEAEALKK
jgi:DNA-binding protein WhiA